MFESNPVLRGKMSQWKSGDKDMVQLKYFGDDRDYFKYDLITTIFEKELLHNYVFIPMLTRHRDDSEGNKKPVDTGDKSPELLELIKKCNGKSLDHWERWLAPYVSSYKTVHPPDEIIFSDQNRAEYWDQFADMMSGDNTLVFVDPDTGLQSGKASYRKEKGPEKYILDEELAEMFARLSPASVLMIYQHLPNNKHDHVNATSRKMAQAKAVCKGSYICAYREDDLAFLFIMRTKSMFERLYDLLEQYHAKSTRKYKGLFKEGMKKQRMIYNEESDVLHLAITDELESGSVEIIPNITAELNARGELIGIEILNASAFIRDSILDSVQARILGLNKTKTT